VKKDNRRFHTSDPTEMGSGFHRVPFVAFVAIRQQTMRRRVSRKQMLFNQEFHESGNKRVDVVEDATGPYTRAVIAFVTGTQIHKGEK